MWIFWFQNLGRNTTTIPFIFESPFYWGVHLFFIALFFFLHSFHLDFSLIRVRKKIVIFLSMLINQTKNFSSYLNHCHMPYTQRVWKWGRRDFHWIQHCLHSFTIVFVIFWRGRNMKSKNMSGELIKREIWQ